MKRYGKRIVSAVLIVVLLITLLPSIIGENSYYAEASGQPKRLDKSDNGDNTHRIRGVVDDLSELPSTTEGELGSPSYPFLVLEIVPYEEYAEFGYLISGCEPVNIHDIFIDRKIDKDNGFDVIKTLDKLGTSYITPMGTVYFFEDEDEEYAEFAECFDDEGRSTREDLEGVFYYTDVVYGYFQRVESGEGDWKIIESEDSVSSGDSGDVSSGDFGDVSSGDSETESDEGDEEKPFPFEKVDFGEGEWIWHTFSDEEREKHEAEFDTSSDDSGDASNDALTKAGAYTDPSTLNPDDLADNTKYPLYDYVYTWRTPTEEQKCIQVENYYTYKNKDLFLKQTLGLSDDEDVENYSIVVKTITPSELNSKSAWIDRANLIYLSSASHKEVTTADQSVGHNDSDLAKIWGSDGEGNGYGYGWLFRENVENHPYYNTMPASYAGTDSKGKALDLDWNTVRKLYDKVTKETDYAALIMDDYIYNPNSSLFTGTTKNSFQINVYDWNLNKTGETWTIQKGSSNNNIYKLGIMLMAMDSSLFKNLYLEPVNDGKEALIVDGIDTRRTGEGTSQGTKNVAIQADYWSVETFLLDIPSPYRQADYASLGAYWESDELWNYHSTTNPTDSKYKYWVNDHVFTCPGDKGILTGYDDSYSEEVKNNNYEKLFSEFVLSESVENPQAPRPADAVNYILRNIEKEPEESKQTVNVLDLEPSVRLVLNGDGSVGGYNWFLTESYVQMLLGGTDKDINITHQTTAEFISKTEDLVSTYHLIYIGLDVGAYNTVANVPVTLTNSKNSSVNLSLPDWNDGSLGHLIYTHSGDWLLYQKGGASYNIGEYPAWVWTGSETSLKTTGYNTTNDIIPEADWYVRFPGNDISHKKMLELETFLAAGHPVVAERYLYNLEKQLIDQNSFIYQFVSINAKKEYLYDSKAVAAARPDFECQYCLEGKSHPNASSTQAWSKVYSAADVVDIARDFNAASDFREKVSFEEWPQIYNEHGADGKPKYQYLKVEGNVAVLPFSWKTNDKSNDWLYRIYIDLDGDSKFEHREDYSEIIEEGKVYSDPQGKYSTACYITAEIPGPVQWKIEVYQNANPNEKYVKTGCSAVSATISGEENKTTIKVLQIMPQGDILEGDEKRQTGYLNMSDPENGFLNLFKELEDYKIDLKSITFKDYEGYFTVTNKFDYNVDVTGKTTDLGNWKDTHGLLDYDVIVVGFEDSSGLKDLSDAYGAVQFLWFWVDQGRGILFTHDLTSMYISLDVTDASKMHYGTRVSNLLRDAMGMNRYGAISAYAGNDRVEKLLEYQKQQVENDSDNVHFDWMKDPSGKAGKKIGRQGYTYVAMYFFSMGAHMNKSASTPKMLYQNLPDATNTSDWLSETASRVNEGTVTAYPYEIGEKLTVAETHTQYYSMNPEDEDVVVWYSLAENKSDECYSYYVSPNDGLNNYYIYSRNNVFYSGVGHETVAPGSEEAKLLVNVIIAAYNAGKSRASYVLVEDAEQIAAKDGAQKSYEVKLTQNYDGWSLEDDDLYKLDKEDLKGEDDVYVIKFRPLDAERQASWYECVIVYEFTDKDGNIHKEIFSQTLDAPLGVYAVDNGERVSSKDSEQKAGMASLGLGDDVKVLRLENNKDYYLKFNRNDVFWKELAVDNDVDVDSCQIVFYLRNNITLTKWAKTTVDVSILPLFLLE